MNVSSPQRAATVEFLPLRRQTAEVREELDLAVSEVLDASRFVLGEPAERFERAFARYCGLGHAIGVASGADAITIALLALGVGSGDEVITAGNTCLPTVAAIAATGATPVLVDPDPETLTVDPSLLPGAVSGRTAAIVPVHLYGQCADMDQIGSFARTHHPISSTFPSTASRPSFVI